MALKCDPFGSEWKARFAAALEPWTTRDCTQTPAGSRLICKTPPDFFQNGLKYLYLHHLYAPLSESRLSQVITETVAAPPDDVLAFLSFANGAKLFGDAVSLFGFTGGGGTIDRSLEGAQDRPISLRYGNLFVEIEDKPRDAIRLGSLTAGYFAKADIYRHPDGTVRCVTHRDYDRIAKTWPSFDAMVLSEVGRLAPFFGESGMPRVDDYSYCLPELRDWNEEQRQVMEATEKSGPFQGLFHRLKTLLAGDTK